MACSVSSEKLPYPEKLKTAIAKSIEIPFQESDTLIYLSFIGICGNLGSDYLNRYYEPQLNEDPYAKILRNNYKGKIWFTGDDFYILMDSVCQGKEKTKWDCFSKNKIEFSLTGEAISNNSVEIYERYFFENKVHSINKVFEYKDDSWRYRITETELSE